MQNMQLLADDNFWKFLISLEELKIKKEKTLFCEALKIDQESFMSFSHLLNHLGVVCHYDQKYIYPLEEKYRFKIEFSLAEWLALKSVADENFNPDNTKLKYYYKIIQSKLLEVEKASQQFSIYKRPINIEIKKREVETLRLKIDRAIANKTTISLIFFNEKECSILPYRLVFLDGLLCLVGECIKNKTLLYFGLDDIFEIVGLTHLHRPNLSQIEVNEFISHLRIINGKEERVVIKIYSQSIETDFLPPYHYLGNPFVTSNSEGDLIWAATLELGPDIYNWLYTLKDRIEVLDPGHVRKEFTKFCDIKNEELGLKKAS